MADTIADLVAHLGLDVDKGSFDKAREALNQLAMVEMEKVIAKANEMGMATKKAVEGLTHAAHEATHAAHEAGHGFGMLGHILGVAGLIHIGHTIEGWAHHAIKAGAAMGDLADKTGTSVEEIQELGYAAQIHGMSTEFMANTLGKLAVNLDKAAKKGGEAAEPFKKAGIAIKDAEGKARPAADVMANVADRLHSLSEEERPAEAVKLLGKAGKELIPLLKDGSEGLEKFRKEARDLGLVMSKETVESMDKVEKNTKRLGKAWEGIKEHAVAALIPEIEKLTDSLLKWYNANKEDVAHVVHEVFHLILIVVKALAKTFMVLIKVTAAMAKSWKALTVILVAAGIAYGILHTASIKAGLASFKAGLMAAKGWIIAAAPLIALTALIAGVILAVEDFIGWMHGDDSVFGEIFGDFKDNKWAQSLAKGFEVAFEGVKKIIMWISAKLESLLDKAYHMYRGIFKSDEVKKEQASANTAIQAGANISKLSDRREELLNKIRGGEGFGGAGFAAVQLNSVSRQLNSEIDTQAAARADLKINNTININGGDTDKVRQVVGEELAKNNRQLEATVGGGKVK